MVYELPNGISTASELNFDSAICPVKNPTRQKGYPIASKGMTPVLGFKCKKWGNGTNRSTVDRPKLVYRKCSEYRI